MATTLFTSSLLLLLTHHVSAQNGDGGAASGNIPATSVNGDAAGAAGSSTGVVKLSTGAIVAVALIVAIIIIAGISTAVLFYQAKKRQLTIRETLRRSTRRVTTGLKSALSPLTPHRATFSPDPSSKSKRNGLSVVKEKTRRGPSPLRKGQANKGIGFDVDMQALNARESSEERDLEKGEARVEVREKRERPKRPGVVIPGANRREEAGVPKTPMFNKVFGRD